MNNLQLQRLTALSEFAQTQIKRLDKTFTNFAQDQVFAEKLDEHKLNNNLNNQLISCQTEAELAHSLRVFRNLHQTRLIYKMINKLADYHETVHEASMLACVCVQQAYDWLYQDLSHTISPPQKNDGTPLHLVIIGMGKLGALELNLSSDIDLIFAYPEKSHSYTHIFFTKLGQKLIKTLNDVTADGFVYRVDMRLRPFGSNSSLVLTFDAICRYYQTHGRDWERYALIKSAPIAGDITAGWQLMALLRPFVYRRYVDFSAISAMREMKANLAAQALRQDRTRNLKLGVGGIREVEFIAQVFQLIYGGRNQNLQQRNLLQALKAIAEHKYLPTQTSKDLTDAYIFLRNTEHAIQAINDQQTHDLPIDVINQKRIVKMLDFSSWQEFEQQLNYHRNLVAKHFAELIADESKDNSALNEPNLWHTLQFKNEDNLNLLRNLGFQYELQIAKQLADLHQKAQKRTSNESLKRLNIFMPKLLQKIAKTTNPSQVLQRILPLLHAVLRRSAYLTLLDENPHSLDLLITLCAKSPLIAEQIALYPLLLAELLDGNLPQSPPTLDALNQELHYFLRQHNDNFEQQMEQLRHFKLAHTLKACAAYLVGNLTLMTTSDYLTWLAEAILGQTLDLAWQHVSAKYGVPLNTSCTNSNFIIVGYGKLGGLELGLGSDLDLVFIYDLTAGFPNHHELNNVDLTQFFTKLAQRIIHILTTQTMSGKLYEIDLRLRPSGASGLLVSSFTSFSHYQEFEAWVWEHQALLRARVLVGDQNLQAKFEQLRVQVLTKNRDFKQLRTEISHMRHKMHNNNTNKAGFFKLKGDAGGIIDLEFMVQFLALAYAKQHPSIIQFTDNIRILDELGRLQILPLTQAQKLQQIYLSFRSQAQKLFLQKEPPCVSDSFFKHERQQIINLWQQLKLDDI